MSVWKSMLTLHRHTVCGITSMKYIKPFLVMIAFLFSGLLAIKVPIVFFGPLVKALFKEHGIISGLLGYLGLHSLILLVMLSLLWIFSTKIERSSLAQYAVFVGEKSLTLFGLGTIITLCIGAIASFTYLFVHRPQYELLHHGTGTISTILLLSCIATLLQVTYEELWFRSLVLKKLAQVVGPFGAALILGGGFGFVHLLNPQYSLLAMISAASAGIMLCSSVFITQSLWMAIGLHFGWNVITSGLIYNKILFNVATSDGRTITAFIGAEATIAGAFLPLMAVVLILALPKICGATRWIDIPFSTSLSRFMRSERGDQHEFNS